MPAGVIRVQGAFASHQAVRLIVRRRKRADREEEPADLTLSRSSMDGDWATPPRSAAGHVDRGDQLAPFAPVPPVAGPSKLRNTTIVTTEAEAANVEETDSANLTATPPTPAIEPILSLSSSIASLDPLSRSGPNSPAIHAIAERLLISTLGEPTASAGQTSSDSTQQVQLASASEDDQWEEVEIGKGLAQYNSVEIDRLKGMKRCVFSPGSDLPADLSRSSHIEKVLGYCESEHVVDSILIWQ